MKADETILLSDQFDFKAKGKKQNKQNKLVKSSKQRNTQTKRLSHLEMK